MSCGIYPKFVIDINLFFLYNKTIESVATENLEIICCRFEHRSKALPTDTVQDEMILFIHLAH